MEEQQSSHLNNRRGRFESFDATELLENDFKKPPVKKEPQSAASSQGSANAFLTSMLASPELAHTPPVASSYELSHMKRARSGSVSGRLRSASEYLEEKGLLDRHTKGILKDLIIIGDEELQTALDNYEEKGDPKMLEEMIKSGALQNRLPQDLDILGDLDLDFLTMDESSFAAPVAFEKNAEAAALQLQQLHNHHQPNTVTPNDYDGIGELEFNGEFDNYHAEEIRAESPSERSSASSTHERRMRSNSLFSGLLSDPKAKESNASQWTDRVLPSKGIKIRKPVRRGNSGAGIGATLKKKRKEKKSRVSVKRQQEEEHVHVPGSGFPRSLSDPNLRFSLDEDGLQSVKRPDGWVGAYSPDSRKLRIERFLKKRNHRVWTKSVKYDVRKNFADSRLRVKGRFVKKEEEVLMRELMSLT